MDLLDAVNAVALPRNILKARIPNAGTGVWTAAVGGHRTRFVRHRGCGHRDRGRSPTTGGWSGKAMVTGGNDGAPAGVTVLEISRFRCGRRDWPRGGKANGAAHACHHRRSRWRGRFRAQDEWDRFKVARQERVPMGRLGRPEEVASVLDFLLSERSAYLTGQIVHPNGGQLGW